MTGFKPERWLSSETTPSDFLAFGAGPRYDVFAVESHFVSCSELFRFSDLRFWIFLS